MASASVCAWPEMTENSLEDLVQAEKAIEGTRCVFRLAIQPVDRDHRFVNGRISDPNTFVLVRRHIALSKHVVLHILNDDIGNDKRCVRQICEMIQSGGDTR